MRWQPPLTVLEARTALETLHATTQTARLKDVPPTEAIKAYHAVIRSVVTREEQHRYSLNGFYGITMGTLQRAIEELLRDFDGLVEDNPRLTTRDTTPA